MEDIRSRLGARSTRASRRPRSRPAILARLTRALRDPLYANAYALLANQVSSAALGFLYWLLAARLYPVDVVGRSSAMISTLLLVASLSQLGLDAGMVRFVPRAGPHTRRLALTAYLVVPACAAVLSVGFLWLGAVLHLDEKLASEGLPPWILVAATVSWSLFIFQDGVLNGLRRSVWVLGENLVYNVSKIVLLVAGIFVLKDAGIIGSWFLPTPVTIVLVAWLVFGRFLRPGSIGETVETGAEPATKREIVRSVTGDHAGSVVAEASVRLLPLLVVALLGTAENAYFYQAWLVANTLTLAAGGMTHSFTAHAAGDPANTAAYSRAILRQVYGLLVPVAVVIGVGAQAVLTLFGGAYAAQATTLLRLLALGVPLVVFDTWYLAYERVGGHIRRVIALQVLGAVLLLGLAYPGIRAFGITGVALAWLVSRAGIALAGLPRARALFSRSSSTTVPGPADGLLTPDEARLVLPLPVAGVSRVFGGEDEASAARPGPCDLAFVRRPTAERLRTAFDALAPGGACYSEWVAWRHGGAAGVARGMRAAGFTESRLYWPVGRRGRGRLLLPLPASPTYARVIGGLVAERVPRPLRDAAFLATAALARAGPAPALAVVAYKPGSSARPGRELADVVLTGLADSGEDPAGCTLVMATGAGACNRKAHWLVYSGTAPSLRWVVKLPRRDEDADAVRAELGQLRYLARRDDLDGHLAVPRVAFATEETGFPVFAESALPGERLDGVARHEPYGPVAALVTDAFVTLAAPGAPMPPAAWHERLVAAPLAALERSLAGLGEERLVEGVRDVVSEFGPLPLVYTHNDCSPGNIMLADGLLGLFDWETGREAGLPIVDLAFCLANLAFFADGTANTPDSVLAYRGLLDGSDARAVSFHAELARYASAVGVDPDDIPRLRTLAWLYHTVSGLDSLRGGSGALTPSSLARCACLPLLRAEVADAASSGRATTGTA